MKIFKSEHIFPGEEYTNEEILEVNQDALDRLAWAGVDFGSLFGPEWFKKLGVETRSLVCTEANSSEWWEEWRGKDPIAQAGADVYELLMKEEEPLAENDRLIVVSNVFDTHNPNLATYILSYLERRNPGFVKPDFLSLCGEGCSGYISALREADLYIKSNPGSRVVVLSDELTSPYFHGPVQRELEDTYWASQHSTYYEKALKGNMVQRFLFGDGLTAAICGSDDSERDGLLINRFKRFTNIDPLDVDVFGIRGVGTKGEPMPPFGYFYQDPKKLFARLAESYVPAMAGALAQLKERPKAYAVHTGSGPILKAVCDAFQMDESERLPSATVLANHGNMNTNTGAVIVGDLLKMGVSQDAFLAFFGVGFTAQVAWGEP